MSGRLPTDKGVCDSSYMDQHSQRVSTGVPGLDEILQGGWPAERMHMVLGAPGAGKTTLGLQFLLEGAARDEPTL